MTKKGSTQLERLEIDLQAFQNPPTKRERSDKTVLEQKIAFRLQRTGKPPKPTRKRQSGEKLENQKNSKQA